MIIEIEERVLSYRPEQLRSWKASDKSIIPGFVEIPPIIRNQPGAAAKVKSILRIVYGE
jgi:hypothetical protein